MSTGPRKTSIYLVTDGNYRSFITISARAEIKMEISDWAREENLNFGPSPARSETKYKILSQAWPIIFFPVSAWTILSCKESHLA